jgi:hypothetical protein
MTQALKKVFAELQQLPRKEQDEIANLIIQELKWNAKLENNNIYSQKLAGEALQEYKKGTLDLLSCYNEPTY